MSYGWWFLMILVTSLATFWVANRVMRPKRIPFDRLVDQRPLPGELPIAGYLPPVPETADGEYYERKMGELFDLPGVLAATTYVCDRCGLPQRACTCPKGPHNPWPLASSYGPFPVDTGPLLHLSEQAAARIALERDIEAMCAEAEAKIPPRWR